MTLRVLAHSDVDTTLVVQLADGTYLCNDDTDGRDPVVEGSFPAGNHNVYVGTYSAGQTAPYTLGLTVNPAITPSTMQSGMVPPIVGGPTVGSGPTGGGVAPKWPPLYNSVSAAWTVPSPPLMTSNLGLTRAIVAIASPIWSARSTS